MRQIKADWRCGGGHSIGVQAEKSASDSQSLIIQPLRAIDRVNGCLTHFSHSQDEIHGWMLRVDAFQLHALFEAVLYRWHSLRLDTYQARLNIQTASLTEVQF